MFNRTYRLNLTKLTLVPNKSMDDISKVDNIILVVLRMIVKRKVPSKIRLIVHY